MSVGQRDPESLERRRRRGVALLRVGLSPAAVARRLNVTPAAVSQWRRTVRLFGPGGLSSTPHRGRTPRLSASGVESLAALRSPAAMRFRTSVDISTSSRLQAFVLSEWGIRYSRSGVWRLMRRRDERRVRWELDHA